MPPPDTAILHGHIHCNRVFALEGYGEIPLLADADAAYRAALHTLNMSTVRACRVRGCVAAVIGWWPYNPREN